MEHLEAQRVFQSADKDSELLWNSPREWRPSDHTSGTRFKKGILLVHGLGDSPWSFFDMGRTLSEQGFLVRSVLLPGHGTRPEDLLDVSVDAWRAVVRDQVIAMQNDVENVYLGGFSTGANLIVEYAYSDPDIQGLALFSPGFKSNSFDWLAPLVKPIRPWLLAQPGSVPMQNAVRYLNVPTNGFVQFYRSSVAVRELLGSRNYDKPVFMVVAQHDSVLDTHFLLDVFQRRFTHPASRLIWYGDQPDNLTDEKRVFVRKDRFVDLKISQFSHMGVLFSPQNPLYGQSGSLRLCRNGQRKADSQACATGAPVWYSDWGYRERGKIHARLTFNPYYDWQASIMQCVLAPCSTEAVSSLTQGKNALP
ncbi:alpha/beta fold hydrolase [Pseudomonas capsici]|uniref:alpha/beta hydrolase n=1 Tax=Pseudomonas capsici TaxID=2810614 RepID=UPI0021F121E4|nr:alpha/beta fold hydrolase [Pseudomonas capsici]MCV4275849.1 alpha/beta fold hydrolase [Pseudomonas capsici]